jgi:hypothetical protein
MSAYEHEVRIVLDNGSKNESKEPEPEIRGYQFRWDPEENIERIYVHPDADEAFMETVSSTLTTYAPALVSHVRWSAMIELPPF